MRHLKKYNESNEGFLSIHYIFLNLIEDWNAKEVKLPPQYSHPYYEIMVPLPSMVNTPRELGVDKDLVEFLDSYIQKSSRLQEFCNEIKVSIKRVEMEFPQVKIGYSVFANDDRRWIKLEIYNFTKK